MTPSFHLQQSCCTNVDSGQPFWLRYTTATQSATHIHEQIDTHPESAKAQADKCSKTLAPLYAGQPVATYDTLQKILVPATVICILPQDSYQVHTSNGSTYCHMWRHLCEHSIKAADTVPSDTTTTLQALTRHCFLAHTCCTCNTGNPDETGSSCSCHTSCSEDCPGTNACNIPCHTWCSHKDPAMPTWHQDA